MTNAAMPDPARMLAHGAVLSVIASLVLLGCLLANPRLLVQDYPGAIRASVAPQSAAERRVARLVGVPFVLLLLLVPAWSSWTMPGHDGALPSFGALFVNTFVVASIFNVVDWLVLDWLVFCTITPRVVVIPGTEGMRAYKDYAFHFRGFVVGTVLSAALAAIVAAVVRLAR